MECKWHAGEEAEFTCPKCGQLFCRECEKETRSTYYCPECHEAEVQRFASQLGVSKAKPAKGRHAAPSERMKKKAEKESKRLSKPVEKPVVQPVTMPEEQVTLPHKDDFLSGHHEAFWGESEKSRGISRLFRRKKVAPVEPAAEAFGQPLVEESTPAVPESMPAELKVAEPEVKPAEHVAPPSPVAPEPEESPHEPVPPFLPDEHEVPASAKGTVPEAHPVSPPPVAPELPPLPPIEDIVPMGAVSGKAEKVEVPGFEIEKAEVVAEPPSVLEKPAEPAEFLREDEGTPISDRLVKRAKKARSSSAGRLAMQLPDDYEGALTEKPSYLKAILWSLLAGVVGAGLYGVVVSWRHREFGILGWVLGIAVGLAVVFGSGRHFNWKLGLIAAIVSMVFISVGRIFSYMMEVWFPPFSFKVPIGFTKNFHEAVIQFGKQFFTTWLVFFFTTALIAFLISFRPWPVRLHIFSPKEHSDKDSDA